MFEEDKELNALFDDLIALVDAATEEAKEDELTEFYELIENYRLKGKFSDEFAKSITDVVGKHLEKHYLTILPNPSAMGEAQVFILSKISNFAGSGKDKIILSKKPTKDINENNYLTKKEIEEDFPWAFAFSKEITV